MTSRDWVRSPENEREGRKRYLADKHRRYPGLVDLQERLRVGLPTHEQEERLMSSDWTHVVYVRPCPYAEYTTACVSVGGGTYVGRHYDVVVRERGQPRSKRSTVRTTMELASFLQRTIPYSAETVDHLNRSAQELVEEADRMSDWRFREFKLP